MSRTACFSSWLLPLAFLLFAGCSGSGGGSGAGATLQIQGAVQLPAQVPLKPEQLTVVSYQRDTPIGADGRFDIEAEGAGPAYTALQDGSGRVILSGFLDAAQPREGNVLSARSTALALLAHGLTPLLIAPDYRRVFLDLLSASAEVDAVAAVIVQQMQLSPTAVNDGDALIAGAVVGALERLSGSSAITEAARSLAPVPATQTPGWITVQGGLQSGINVTSPASNGEAMLIANVKRRHVMYSLYRTGCRDKDGNEIPYAAADWIEMTHANNSMPQLQYVPAVNGYSGAIGTVFDFFTQDMPLKEQNSAEIVCPVAPDDAQATYYQVFVTGPARPGVTKAQFTALLPADAQLNSALVDQAWLNYNYMSFLELFQEIVVPVAFPFLPSDMLSGCLRDGKLVSVSNDVLTYMVAQGLNVPEQLANGDWPSAVRSMIRGVLDSQDLRQYIVMRMVNYGLLKKIESSMSDGDLIKLIEGRVNSALFFLRVTQAFDTALKVIDVSTIMSHLSGSRAVDAWNVTATPPLITLLPDPAEVAPGKQVALTGKVRNYSGTFTYAFHTDGAHGTLVGLNGSGNDLEQSTGDIHYEASASAQEGDTDGVTLTVYMKQGLSRVAIGSASAGIRVSSAQTWTIAAFQVDDNMTLWQNGTVLFQDPDGAFAGWRGPFTIKGVPGDVLRLQVRDYYGFYAGVYNDVDITRPDGSVVTWVHHFQVQTDPGSQQIVLDTQFTLN